MIVRPLDAGAHPPAPVVTLPLAVPGGAFSACRSLVDTGADRTAVPAAAAGRCGFRSSSAGTLPMRAFDGTLTTLPAGTFHVVIGQTLFRPFCVVHQGEPIGLLGRDVLQHLRLAFDGPAGTFSLG